MENIPQEQLDRIQEKTEVKVTRFGEEQCNLAYALLDKYRNGKSALDSRLIDDKAWFKNRHWETENKELPKPASGWLHNVITSKHADAMDNYPTPNVLPRERGDKQSADTLSEVIPVILEHNRFRNVYASAWWDKLTDGGCCYGIFWDQNEMNGLGDIVVKQIDLLSMYWKPGIRGIQDSDAVFIVKLMDNKYIKETWGIEPSGDTIGVKQYVHDDSIDTSDMTPVVDYYYKVNTGNKVVTHYAKLCAQKVIFASENEEQYADGFYQHGKFPFVIDSLFPEKDSPVGFGYVSLMKYQQLNIDKLESNILENSLVCTKPRYFAKTGSGVKNEDLIDLSKAAIPCNGEIDSNIKPLQMPTMSGVYYNVLDLWINQFKEVSSNRDVSNGSAGSATAASAIAALQEAGNKQSRDMIGSSYTAFEDVCYLVVELVRQFYNVEREFRITGKNPGQYEFINFSNAGIVPTETMVGGEQFTRVPVFDIKCVAEKKSPFSQMALNESAKEMYSMGFFNPQRAQEASIALNMMQFEGKEEILEQVMQGETMYNLAQSLSQQLEKAMQIIGVQGVQTMTPAPAAQSTSSAIEMPKDPMQRRLDFARSKAVPDMGGGVE